MISILFVAALGSTTPATNPAEAPTETSKAIEVGALRLLPLAQLRVRAEVVPDRTLSGATPELAFTQRARVGAKASLDVVDLVVRVQDVRAWGSERVAEGLPPDPTIYGAVADGFSLHEAYAGVHLGALEARVGRQEIVIGNERLVGNADWLQRGRAFDAVRLLGDHGDVAWSAFAALISSSSNAATFEVFGGAHLELQLAPWSKLSPIIANTSRAGDDVSLTTVGARVDGAAGGFAYDVEAYGQSTLAPDTRTTVGALLGARASYRFDTMLKPRIGVLTDVVSGSAENASLFAPFNTLYATNHKFYGFQDMFTALPLHTKGRGLVDNAVSLSFAEGPWSVASVVHVFAPFATERLDVPLYGVEPDIVGSFKPTPNVALDLGCALFMPVGNALGRGTQPAAWSYAQLNVQL